MRLGHGVKQLWGWVPCAVSHLPTRPSARSPESAPPYPDPARPLARLPTLSSHAIASGALCRRSPPGPPLTTARGPGPVPGKPAGYAVPALEGTPPSISWARLMRVCCSARTGQVVLAAARMARAQGARAGGMTRLERGKAGGRGRVGVA
jgi:hypothetical protein